MFDYLLQVSMPVLSDKKNETLTLKVGSETKELFLRVSEKEDRSMSYIIRELALRGLAHYTKDGQLKLTKEEENDISFCIVDTEVILKKEESSTNKNKLRPTKMTQTTGEIEEAKQNNKKKTA